MKFVDLGLPSDLIEVLTRQGIEVPFDVQASTIPDAIAGRDVAARAPTGSGKTLAFGLPTLARLGKAKPRRPRGLILAPTRELAEQIRRALEPLAAAVDRTVVAVYGGVGFGPQVKALKRGVDLLVACPGRLQDLLNQGELSLNEVDRVVIDEADRMADMGFLPVVQELLDLTSAKRQTLLFSATLDNDIAGLSKRYQTKPARHEVGEVEPDLSLVDHVFFATDKGNKLGLAADLIEDHGPTMVFCRTRHGVDRVARQLKRVGVKTGWIHGGRTQAQRDAALSAFTTGRVNVLVATDVAARGIHVDGVACVIHYDPPADHKDYVHRSGRTARAGSGGVVVSLVNNDQRRAVARLRKTVGLPAGDPEDAPPLRPRTIEPWVDQRPNEPRRSSKGKPRATSGQDRKDRAERKDRADGRAESRPASVKAKRDSSTSDRARSKPASAKAKSRSKADNSPKDRTRTKPGSAKTKDRSPSKPASAKGKRGESGSKERTKDTPTGRTAGSKEQTKAKATPAERTAGKAKAKASSARKGKKSKAKAASKRSGRPRAKDHKQRRQR